MLKKIFLFTFVSLIISTTSFAQQDLNTLILNKFKIELDGKPVEYDSVFDINLVQDQLMNKIIYDDHTIKYGVEFTYKFKGRRAKLTRRTYVLLADGTKKYSKRKKDMQELKVSVPGFISGVSAESILYNKAIMSSIFVRFNYSFKYKE